MQKAYDDVLAFHRQFGIPAPVRPAVPKEERIKLREKLIDEEYMELVAAMDKNDMVAIADACADLIYVVIGTALEYGIPLPNIWDAVQLANMSKIGGQRRADGKILKPDGWKSPEETIKAILDFREDSNVQREV